MTTQPIAPAFQDPNDELTAMSALQQAALIKTGEISSRELVTHYLDRIERFDPELHAFADLFADQALKDADVIDKRRATGEDLGLFGGVPTALKDHHMIRFRRTRMGSRAFDWLYSPIDDKVVKSLKSAGMVLLGKTTMSELGLLPLIDPPDGPATRNPWATNRLSGGSSGGAGSAIAAGLIPLSPGSDGAGSIRIPAALNGLIGLKPTRGLVKDGTESIDPYGLTVIGPMARHLDDATALLDVLARAHGSYLERRQWRGHKLRIGLITEPPFGTIEPALKQAVLDAAHKLEAAGHHIEERPSPQGTLEEFTPLYQRYISRVPVMRPNKLQPLTRWFRDQGKQVSEEESWRIYRKFEALGLEAMTGLDVLLQPTVPIFPPFVGQFDGLTPPELFRQSAPLGAFTALANITGQPGLSLPTGSHQGLPLSVQLLGRKGDDLLLLWLARALQ